jgi:Flp pilus assembly protein TadG
MKRSKQGFFAKLAQFRRDHRGISAVEFAFVFPVMAALYLGGTAASQGIVIMQKVTMSTSILGDLVSQDTNVNNAEKDAIFTAAVAVMAPYPTPVGTWSMVVSSLNIDQNGNATVLWSDTYQGTARTVGSSVTLPAGINVPSTTVIMSEATYSYIPPVGSAFFPSLPLKQTFYFRPRRVTTITRSVT